MLYMNKKIAVIVSVLATALAGGGCATYGGYQPVVDPRADPNYANIQQDSVECGNLAKQAGNVGVDTLKGAGVGALVGAAGGAAIGAIVGNPGTGAALGAAAGGIGGGASQGMDADNNYKRAFNNCMRGRGHNPIN
jgi:hypothetical protein